MNIDTEDLNYLLDIQLSLEDEKQFYEALFLLYTPDPTERYSMSYITDSDSESVYLNASRIIVRDIIVVESKKSLAYQLASNAVNRAKALMEQHQPTIQKIFDMRMAIIKEIPELERMFLERYGRN